MYAINALKHSSLRNCKVQNSPLFFHLPSCRSPICHYLCICILHTCLVLLEKDLCLFVTALVRLKKKKKSVYKHATPRIVQRYGALYSLEKEYFTKHLEKPNTPCISVLKSSHELS